MTRFPVCFLLMLLAMCLSATLVPARTDELKQCNITWNSQSRNAAESMPCGGGDIGLNVWVENGDLLVYLSQSGAFDENNQLLKAGRLRVKMSPNPFSGADFRQELSLKEGCILIHGSNKQVSADLKVWVDVYHPVVHIAIVASMPVTATAGYESWRFADRELHGKENNANSYKWAPGIVVITRKDSIGFNGNQVVFYHRNSDSSVFDVTVHQEGMDQVKNQLFNPLINRISGGMLSGKPMRASGTYTGNYQGIPYKGWQLETERPSKKIELTTLLGVGQYTTVSAWQDSLNRLFTTVNKQPAKDEQQTGEWWRRFWDRSFVFIQPADTSKDGWPAGRNYQLFRYMLGCNAFGKWPTKFNGGLFTFDPVFTDSNLHATPDFRNWGGGTYTAQNQRLVYFPMLKSGDDDLLRPQLDFYQNILHNATLRSKVYWQHEGACFTEQIENFGLPNVTEYGWSRPAGIDKGMEYNAWLEYEWDTVLEFCLMMLDEARYTGKDISSRIPFIKSCIEFFDNHYQYLARARGRKALDGAGHLVLYPGSAGETYKMAYNSSSTISGLKTILTRVLEMPAVSNNDSQKKYFMAVLSRIPPISFREFNGHTCIAPALLWERINNSEAMQLYPVFPWGVYGIGKPDLAIARNTWSYDTSIIKFRSSVGWKQDNIFAARLGLTEEARSLNLAKMKNSGRRFPAFWGPGFDWTPDHNWGGSGMIGIQEMLLQTDDRKIFLFPAWPPGMDVHFKLHAPYNTTVEGELRDGKVTSLIVVPESRRADIVNLLGKNGME